MFWDPNKKEKTMKRAGASASAFVWVEGIKMALEGRSAKNQSELPQKAKVKCHKKPKYMSYYHDRYNLEADWVLHLGDGRYA